MYGFLKYSRVRSGLSIFLSCFFFFFWGGGGGGGPVAVQIDKLLLLQKKVVRIITRSEYLAHSEPLFVENGILKVKKLYKYQCCLYLFDNSDLFNKIVHCPQYEKYIPELRTLISKDCQCLRNLYPSLYLSNITVSPIILKL